MSALNQPHTCHSLVAFVTITKLGSGSSLEFLELSAFMSPFWDCGALVLCL